MRRAWPMLLLAAVFIIVGLTSAVLLVTTRAPTRVLSYFTAGPLLLGIAAVTAIRDEARAALRAAAGARAARRAALRETVAPPGQPATERAPDAGPFRTAPGPAPIAPQRPVSDTRTAVIPGEGPPPRLLI